MKEDKKKELKDYKMRERHRDKKYETNKKKKSFPVDPSPFFVFQPLLPLRDRPRMAMALRIWDLMFTSLK
jgi:hypothetical protein